MSQRGAAPLDVVITGIGVLSPLGDTPERLFQALLNGEVCAETAEDPGVFRIADFDATRYANVRGMRIYNRATSLAICAAKLALVDAGLDGKTDPERLGLATAATFGHMSTLFDYDRSLLKHGMSGTNPALMPLALPSALGSAVALAFNAKAFSITLGDGGVSGLDALGLGARLLASGRGNACVVVSSFDPTPDLCAAAQRGGILSSQENARVFDRSSLGMAFGEGGVALILERASDARERGAREWGQVVSQASTFGGPGLAVGVALERCGSTALSSAGLNVADLGLIFSAASGLPAGDRAEANALIALLRDTDSAPPVAAPAANLGHTLDASGLIGCLAALGCLRARRVAPIVRLETPVAPGLRYAKPDHTVGAPHALVLAKATSGACSATVLRADPALENPASGTTSS